MHAVITQVTEMEPDKTIGIIFDIYDDEQKVSPDNSIRCRPSEVDGRIKAEIVAFEDEAEDAITIEVGQVITTDGAPE